MTKWLSNTLLGHVDMILMTAKDLVICFSTSTGCEKFCAAARTQGMADKRGIELMKART